VRRLLLLLLVGCGQNVTSGRVWTVRDFVARHAAAGPNDAGAFGGWAPADLVAAPDAGLLFTAGRAQASGYGHTVFPGVSEGASLGFIITDIWENHPAPWMQPVYVPVTNDGRLAAFDAESVFPVGVASSFYSPWWQQEFIPVDGGIDSPTRTFLTSAKQVLDANRVLTKGVLVLCPLVDLPDGGRVGVAAALETPADGGVGKTVVRHPLTNARLAEPSFVKAWVDGSPVTYLKLGPNRASAEGQSLVESPLYGFVFRGRLLRTAAVLPPNASARGFVRRFDVSLPSTAGIFVPADRPDLREVVLARDPEVESFLGTRGDAGVGEFHELALRVALNKECFASATFPAACTWLDSEARLQQFASPRPTNVLLTIAVLGAQP
jgi:hypothetical protein